MSVRTPSVDDFLKNYKQACKRMSESENVKLTDVQHGIAKQSGFEDWQSFTYFIKSLSDLDVGFSKEEWLYIYDAINGWYIHLNMIDKKSLVAQLVDSDIYDGAGHRWFKVFSEYEEDVSYTPSKPMKEFIDKIDAMSEHQIKAVLGTGLLFWDRPYHELQSALNLKSK